MSNFDTEIQNRVETFVEELTALIRRAALEAAVSALGGSPSGKTSRGRQGTATPMATKESAGGRVRRTEGQIQQTMAKVLSYVESHAGSRAENIRTALGLTAPQTADALRRLMSEKSLKSKGERRATAYSKS